MRTTSLPPVKVLAAEIIAVTVVEGWCQSEKSIEDQITGRALHWCHITNPVGYCAPIVVCASAIPSGLGSYTLAC
jgi:hypothetical protein